MNSALKPIFSVIEYQCSGGQRSSKWGRQQFKLQAHVKLVNKQPSDFWFHQVLRCFRVVLSQFWTSSKCLLALETTTNNQEVKRSLYRLQNVNNLLKDYIRTSVDLPISRRVVQLYRSCWTSRIHLFEFINISDHSRLINSNILQRKSLIFYCLLKDLRFKTLEISDKIGLDSGVRNKGIPTS